MLISQQLIIHFFLKSSTSVTNGKYYSMALSLSYLINMIVSAYSYARLLDYMETGRQITLRDDSRVHLEEVLWRVDACSKILIGGICLNTAAFLMKLGV